MTSDGQPLPTRRAENRQTLFAALSCVLVSAIALLSFLPYADKAALHTRGRFHSAGHLLIFSVLGYVMIRVSASSRTRILLFIAAVAFSFGIEVAERVTYHNRLEWNDISVDCLGVIAGAILAVLSTPRKRFRTVA